MSRRLALTLYRATLRWSRANADVPFTVKVGQRNRALKNPATLQCSSNLRVELCARACAASCGAWRCNTALRPVYQADVLCPPRHAARRPLTSTGWRRSCGARLWRCRTQELWPRWRARPLRPAAMPQGMRRSRL